MGPLKFLAVGRLVRNPDGSFAENQHQVIAQYAINDDDTISKSYKTHVKQIMSKGAAKLKPGRRLRLISDNQDYDLHVLPDLRDGHIIVFFAVTDTDFNKTHVRDLFHDFQNVFYHENDMESIKSAVSGGTVNTNSQNLLDYLMKKHNQSKLQEVQMKAEEVKGVMKESVKKTLQNIEKLDELNDKAVKINDNASKFQSGSVGIRRKLKCKQIKTALIIFALVAIVITIIVVIAVKK